MTEPYDYEADLDNTDYGDPYIEWEEANAHADDDEPELDEQFEIESGLSSAGWGTDESYGYFGDDPEF